MKSLNRALCLCACSCVALACSSDDESDVARGPDDFAIASVETVSQGPIASGESLSIDCTEPLLVRLLPEISDGALGEFLLAAPGGCDSEVDCGWMVLTVLDEADRTILETIAISSPVRLDLPADERSGTYRFRAELRDSDGNAVLTEAEEVLASEFSVELTTTSDCTAASN